MGCGANVREIPKDNDFYKEAYNYTTQNQDGFVITAETQHLKNQLFRVIDPDNPIFLEEVIERGAENAQSKPWLFGIVPFTSIPNKKTSDKYPHFNLQIEHVFGFHIEDIRNNLFCLPQDKILYCASSVAIIESILDKVQEIFGCDEKTSNKYCHDQEITAIDFLDSTVSMVATGQRGLKPMILLWSPVDRKTIYAKYFLKRGSKEVGGISIDSLGRYVISYGRDEENTFNVFDMQEQNIVYSAKTGNGKLLGCKFGAQNYGKNNKDEFCIVGYQKIIFGNTGAKTFTNMLLKYEKLEKTAYTCCNTMYLEGAKQNIWLIGGYNGDILIFRDCHLSKQFSSYMKGAVEVIYIDKFTNHIYVSDSREYLKKLSIDEKKELKKIEKILPGSSVKAIATNKAGELYLGLKNGTIKRYYQTEKNKKTITETEDLVKSHSEGALYGVHLVDEKRLISVGEDNKILIWNIKSNKCEEVYDLGLPVSGRKNDDGQSLIYDYNNSHKAWCIDYNQMNNHVAIGLCNGNVSIRDGIKNIQTKVIEDISLGREPVSVLKYTRYGNMLAVALLTKEIYLLNPNDSYKTVKTLQFDGFSVRELDWDFSNEFLQVTTDNNSYFVYSSPDLLDVNEIEKNPDMKARLREAHWPEITCKFGYSVQGIYMGSTDPDFITAVGKGNEENIICSGDEDLCLNLVNYPVLTDNCKAKRYHAHSDKIHRIFFVPGDKKLVTVGGKDKSIFIWSVVPE